ncbi:MAG: class I SAM-dependent methyltransferase [Deltaproteobacteria bacterium]|nr:class I SAM-dependent methyltransferase [Deltaproteobacteria bacterium]
MNNVLINKELGTLTARERAYGIEKWLLLRMLDRMGRPPIKFVLWSGEEISSGHDRPVGRIIIRNRKTLLKLLANPNLHFGDAYAEGKIEIDGNLVELLESVYRAIYQASQDDSITGRVSRIINRPRVNSLSGSRENIHHHYDIGNPFYRLWLDENMQYTCAYFASANMTLEEAQVAKMDHVSRKLQLKPGETVVEAGCGWGGLSLHMAKRYGVKVKAFNISRQQILFARERAQALGLSERVEYIEDDYRNISERFDAFVSVGMLEHVGTSNYRELGRVIKCWLKKNGRGLIHSIGRSKAEPMDPWIEKRIFPGAYPPTLREMMEIFEPWGFSVTDVENLRLHYAKTLKHWLERFEEASCQVDKLYDQRFTRAWRLYLAGSIAGFTAGTLQLFQVLFAHPEKSDFPWTRWHQYA